MKKIVSILGAVFVPFWVCVPLVASAEQFLCVTEKASGFAYNNILKQWDNASFEANSTYLVAKSDDEKYALEVTQIGDLFPMSSCKEGFNETGFLHCEGFRDFKFNRKNLRFLAISASGYFNVLSDINKITDEKSATPFLEIGVCSPLQLSP